MVKVSIKCICYHSCNTRLATSWWSPEEKRWQFSCFEKFPNRFAYSDKVFLPYEVVDAFWSQKRRERRDRFFKYGLHGRIVVIFYQKKTKNPLFYKEIFIFLWCPRRDLFLSVVSLCCTPCRRQLGQAQPEQWLCFLLRKSPLFKSPLYKL